MLQILAALGRAVASSAARGAAKGAARGAAKNAATEKMAKEALNKERANARRRFNRQADRYEKQAEKAGGIAGERYNSMAQSLRDKAKSLNAKANETKQWDLINQSQEYLQGNRKDPNMRREMEAGEILRSPAGNRILGGLVDVWRDSENPITAIKEYFGTDSLMDIVERFEKKFGSDLYADPGSDFKYQEIVAEIQKTIRLSNK